MRRNDRPGNRQRQTRHASAPAALPLGEKLRGFLQKKSPAEVPAPDPVAAVPETELSPRPVSRTRTMQFSQKEMRRRRKIGLASAAAAGLVTAAGLFLAMNLGGAKSYPVRILDRGRELEVMAENLTVSDVLSQAEIELASTDIVTPSLDTTLPEEGAVISIRRSFTVTINATDGIHKATLSPGDTVADAMARAGFTVSELDIVTPPLDTVLSSAATVEYIRVTQTHVVQQLRVEYETEIRESSSLYVGQTVVDQKGVNGVLERTLLVTSRDGQEVSRTAVSEVVTREPVNKIVLKGTRPKPTPTPRPTPRPTVKPTAKPAGSNNRPAETKKPAAQTVKPTTKPGNSVNASDLKVPGAPSDYLEIKSMEVTAYTHTGNRTATGTWPRYTRTLDNPGTVAVAPQTIPYHTLMYITGYGYAIAEDTGGFRHTKPMMLDVFMNTTKECIQWGRRRDVQVYIIAYNYKYKG